MRKLLTVLGVVVLCSAPTWADDIYDVNAWAVITAPNSNLTENLDVSFLYNNDLNPSNTSEPEGMVSGSLNLISSGFLGTFSAYCSTCINALYMPLDAAGDLEEIDLDYLNRPLITPGINTVSFSFMNCDTAACTSAYGRTWVEGDYYPGGIQQGSIVTQVNVPDGDSSLLLSLSAFGAFGLAWLWRRKEADEAKIVRIH
jgi:hypothetical protein